MGTSRCFPVADQTPPVPIRLRPKEAQRERSRARHSIQEWRAGVPRSAPDASNGREGSPPTWPKGAIRTWWQNTSDGTVAVIGESGEVPRAGPATIVGGHGQLWPSGQRTKNARVGQDIVAPISSSSTPSGARTAKEGTAPAPRSCFGDPPHGSVCPRGSLVRPGWCDRNRARGSNLARASRLATLRRGTIVARCCTRGHCPRLGLSVGCPRPPRRQRAGDDGFDDVPRRAATDDCR